MLPPSNPPSLLSLLMYYCLRRTLSPDEIASTVTVGWSSTAFCLHHSTQSLPYPSYPVSRAHTSKIGQVATHSATVACRLATYVLSVCFPAPCSTYSAGTCRQDPYLCLISCLRVTCLKKLTQSPSNLLLVVSVSTHVSTTNKSTACTTPR